MIPTPRIPEPAPTDRSSGLSEIPLTRIRKATLPMTFPSSTHPGNVARAVETPLWRDRKKYLWPLGLLIPLSPFISWFLVDNLRLGLFWATGA
ncbi:MAG: alkane 1-monooxygenase, partial [Rhodococcus erythropolis]|nr:alkane 1-monooxygenase [Rhodococcus erythropolis]